MANDNLSGDIKAFIEASDERLIAVARQSIQKTVNDAQTPVSAGGRMRVKTGFLRASGIAAIDTIPSGPSVRPAGAADGQFAWSGDTLIRTLAQLKLGDTFVFGWVAKYARVRETYDGFMGAALQNWNLTVQRYAEELRERINR